MLSHHFKTNHNFGKVMLGSLTYLFNTKCNKKNKTLILNVTYFSSFFSYEGVHKETHTSKGDMF